MQTDIKLDFSFEPLAGKALGFGWGRMKANALIFFLATILILLAEIPMGNDDGAWGDPGPLSSFLIFAYTMGLAPALFYGCDLAFLKGARGDTVESRVLFSGFSNYINVILANLLVYGLVFIGFIALIVPGIYIACRLVFASYLVMDEDLDPVAAVQASWRMTKGHTLDVFLLGFISVFIFLGGLIMLIVGIIPAIMWIKASFASLYLSVSQKNAALEQEEAAVAPDSEEKT